MLQGFKGVTATVESTVKGDRSAIGGTDELAHDGHVDATIRGEGPTNETIGSGEYSLTNDFYVVIRKDAPEDSPERILYNWICSAQGKELVEKENYVAK